MIDDNSIESTAEELGIDISNVYHFNLINGVEIIGELFSTEPSNTIMILNPLKIIRNSWIATDEQFNTEQYLVEWNPCSSEPFIDIKEQNILTKVKINDLTLSSYIMTVHDIYYPMSIKFESDINNITTNNKNNVIEFLPYLINKYNNISN